MKINVSELSFDDFIELRKSVNIRWREMTHSIGQNRGRPLKNDYVSWDWSKTDIELSQEHNCTYANVRIWRLRLGKPKVKGTVLPIEESKTWDWMISASEIARAKNLDVQSVYRLGKMNGIVFLKRKTGSGYLL